MSISRIVRIQVGTDHLRFIWDCVSISPFFSRIVAFWGEYHSVWGPPYPDGYVRFQHTPFPDSVWFQWREEIVGLESASSTSLGAEHACSLPLSSFYPHKYPRALPTRVSQTLLCEGCRVCVNLSISYGLTRIHLIFSFYFFTFFCISVEGIFGSGTALPTPIGAEHAYPVPLN